MPLGMEVGLSPIDIVLDGDPASLPHKGAKSPIFGPCLPRERGTAAPLISAHVSCGHGRPSQLLLSSFYVSYRETDICSVYMPYANIYHEY